MNKVKLNTYNIIKQDWGTAGYLKANVPKGPRVLTSQLLLGTLPLQVKVGHFYNVTHEERLCQNCTANVVEDDIHFPFDCMNYHTLRVKLYHKVPELLQYVNNYDKIKYLLNKPFIFSKYVKDLWNKRIDINNRVK